ncbi:MAG: class I SAM-dependent methyltransferase [Candidatus Obscuribacterales bacterium]|nr:class I SAM-dependent methyltransferase [Candidatus Obscuribacterales bacterium]
MPEESLKASERFTNRAKLYALARPDYPEKAIDFICSHCNLVPGKKLLDLGAGTGISSRAFAARELNVTAVEPNAAMMDEALSHREFKNRIKYIKAAAENTALPDAEFDAVISAQAFHWFQPEPALQEMQRLLKAGAWAVLIWNERDESDRFTKEYGEILRSLPNTASVEMNRAKAGNSLLESSLFKNGSRETFENEQILDLDKFLGRALSASYAPDPDSPEAFEFQERLRALFERYKNENLVCIKYECSVYSAQK